MGCLFFARFGGCNGLEVAIINELFLNAGVIISSKDNHTIVRIKFCNFF